MYDAAGDTGAQTERAAIPQRPQHSPSFRDYVRFRKYDYGRGTSDAWSFIAFVRGDERFPEIASWRELQAYLERSGVSSAFVRGARSAWRSFTAYRSRTRINGGRGSGGCS